jgi:hypothetical protein
MVGLALALPKVPRRAVRILVLTVRSATARRPSDTLLLATDRAAPRTQNWSGGLRYLTGGESGSRSATLLRGWCSGGSGHGFAAGPLIRLPELLHSHDDQGRGGSERLARLPSLAVAYAPVCVRGRLPSRDCHRTDMVPIRRGEETSVVSHQTGGVESSR